MRPCRHGLWVTPLSFVTLTLSPPNSLAVVGPTGTRRPAEQALDHRRVGDRDAVRYTSDASVAGQPATGSNSLIPVGTPPNGSETSARAAAARARSGSRYENTFRSEASIAASVASSSSSGDRSPVRKASTSEHASPCHGMSDMAAIMPPVRAHAPSRRNWPDAPLGQQVLGEIAAALGTPGGTKKKPPPTGRMYSSSGSPSRRSCTVRKPSCRLPGS